MPYPFWTAKDFSALVLPTPRWVIPGLIPGDGWTLLVAPGKTGKSILMIQVCRALTLGEPVLGHPVSRPWKVLYVQADAPAGSWQDQIQHLSPDAEWYTTMPPKGFLDTEPSRALMRETVEATRPEFVVWDALEKLTWKADLNLKQGVQWAIEALRALAPGLPMVLIHHPRKSEEHEDPRKSASGHHYLTTDADAVLDLEWDSSEQVGRLLVITRMTEDRRVRLARGAYGAWALKARGPRPPLPGTPTGLYQIPLT